MFGSVGFFPFFGFNINLNNSSNRNNFNPFSNANFNFQNPINNLQNSFANLNISNERKSIGIHYYLLMTIIILSLGFFLIDDILLIFV